MSGGLCAVAGCAEPVRGRGYCNTHYRRWQRYGDPRADLPIERKITGGVGYWSVRNRLRTERGPAAAQACAECGGPAVDWSYDGSDPAERTCAYRGYRYSLDLWRYRPRCRSCHRRATAARANPRPRCRTVVDIERAARLYEAGASAQGIAQLLGTSRTAIYTALHAAGVNMRPRGTRAPDPDPDEDRPEQDASPDHEPLPNTDTARSEPENKNTSQSKNKYTHTEASRSHGRGCAARGRTDPPC